jgi:hypothetical protein
MAECFALMGWSLPVIESMQKLNKPFVVVSFKDFEQYANLSRIPSTSGTTVPTLWICMRD